MRLSSASIAPNVVSWLAIVALVSGCPRPGDADGDGNQDNDIVANLDTTSTDEDTPIDIPVLANDVFHVGSAPVVSAVTQPAPGTGTVTISATGVLYTPAPDFSGNATFTYTMHESAGPYFDQLRTATVTVNVVPQPDPPTAVEDVVEAVEDEEGSFDLAANDLADVDGDATTCELVDAPATGTAVVNPDCTGTMTTPLHFNGEVTFTYRTFDGALYSPATLVTLDFAPVNDAPVILSTTFAPDEDVLFADTIEAFDPDNDPLAFGLSDDVDEGVLDLDTATGDFDFLTVENLDADQTFTVFVTDGVAQSDDYVLILDVQPVADAPIFVDQTHQTVEDALLSSTLVAVDADGDNLTATLVTDVATGTLVLDMDRDFTYLGAQDSVVTRTFVAEITDGTFQVQATITLPVDPRNDPPTAVEELAGGLPSFEDAGVVSVQAFSGITVGPSDETDTLDVWIVDPDDLVPFVTPPTIDALGVLSFEVEAEACGVTQLEATVCDDGLDGNGHDACTTFLIDATIECRNDPPDLGVLDLDHTFPEDSGSNDVDWYTFELAGPSEVQVVTYNVLDETADFFETLIWLHDGSVEVTTLPNVNGTGEVTVQACDDGPTGPGHDECADPVTLTFDVTAVNDPPTATCVACGSPLQSDEDGGVQTVNVFDALAPGGGADEAGQTVSILCTADPAFFQSFTCDATGECSYEIVAHENGDSTASCQPCDDGPSAGASDQPCGPAVDVPVHVDPTDEILVANDDAAVTEVDTFVDINVLANDTLEYGILFIDFVQNESNVSVEILANGLVRATPAPGFVGTATFEYQAIGDEGGSDIALVTIEVTGAGLQVVSCTPSASEQYNAAQFLGILETATCTWSQNVEAANCTAAVALDGVDLVENTDFFVSVTGNSVAVDLGGTLTPQDGAGVEIEQTCEDGGTPIPFVVTWYLDTESPDVTLEDDLHIATGGFLMTNYRAIWKANESLIVTNVTATANGTPITPEPDDVVAGVRGGGAFTDVFTDDTHVFIPRDKLPGGAEVVLALDATDAFGNPVQGESSLTATVCCDTTPVDWVRTDFTLPDTTTVLFSFTPDDLVNGAIVVPSTLAAQSVDIRVVMPMTVDGVSGIFFNRDGSQSSNPSLATSDQANDTARVRLFGGLLGAKNLYEMSFSARLVPGGSFRPLPLIAFQIASPLSDTVEPTVNALVCREGFSADGGERSCSSAEPVLLQFSESVAMSACHPSNIEVVCEGVTQPATARRVNSTTCEVSPEDGFWDDPPDCTIQFDVLGDLGTPPQFSGTISERSASFEVIGSGGSVNAFPSNGWGVQTLPADGWTNVPSTSAIFIEAPDAVAQRTATDIGAPAKRGFQLTETWSFGQIPVKGLTTSFTPTMQELLRLGSSFPTVVMAPDRAYTFTLLPSIKTKHGVAFGTTESFSFATSPAGSLNDRPIYSSLNTVITAYPANYGRNQFGGLLQTATSLFENWVDDDPSPDTKIATFMTPTFTFNTPAVVDTFNSRSFNSADTNTAFPAGVLTTFSHTVTDFAGNSSTVTEEMYRPSATFTTDAIPVVTALAAPGTVLVEGAIPDAVDASFVGKVTVLLLSADNAFTPPALTPLMTVEAQVTQDPGTGALAYSYAVPADRPLPSTPMDRTYHAAVLVEFISPRSVSITATIAKEHSEKSLPFTIP